MRDRPARPHRPVPIGIAVGAAGVVALLAWLGFQAWDDARRAPGVAAPTVEFAVEGLDCPFWCAVRLSDAIDGLDGAEVTSIDQQQGKVTVRHDPTRQDTAALRAVFEKRGFPVIGTR